MDNCEYINIAEACLHALSGADGVAHGLDAVSDPFYRQLVVGTLVSCPSIFAVRLFYRPAPDSNRVRESIG